MELKILRHFVVIAHERSFSQAAIVLRISQPALSRQIKALEDELGTRLLERHHRELVLTPAGSYLYEQAQVLLKDAGRIKAGVPRNGLSTGALRISCSEPLVVREVSKALSSVVTDFPNTSVTLTSTNTSLDPLPLGIEEDKYDFFISANPPANHDYDSLPLNNTDQWYLLVKNDHPLAQKDRVTLRDVMDQPLLLPENIATTPLSGWLTPESDNLQIRGSFNLESTAAAMVDEGLGVAFYAGTSFDGPLTTVPLKPAVIGHPTLIWLKNRKLSQQAQKFLAYFQAQK
ncbi:LysR family transcriptional regulator [uncultured Secundilactobacillus sp.]|uniref:LysR family transcriptional regulator n=1 Tax=uncultured Secundilactobacillus sp. TaxID=2813935 RepID=UPI0025866C09|nr:LysR family transcriptional regulator [uncultured Secundilactobacillus sp.]